MLSRSAKRPCLHCKRPPPVRVRSDAGSRRTRARGLAAQLGDLLGEKKQRGSCHRSIFRHIGVDRRLKFTCEGKKKCLSDYTPYMTVPPLLSRNHIGLSNFSHFTQRYHDFPSPIFNFEPQMSEWRSCRECYWDPEPH